MTTRFWTAALLLLAAFCTTTPSDAPGQPDRKEPDKKGPPGGFGGPMGQTRKIVKQFDKDGDGRLNAEERKAAREFLQKERANRGGGRGPFGMGGPGGKGKGKGPGGFGPRGDPFTRPLIEALDTDKDGKLTSAELVAGVKKFFTEADRGRKGAIGEEKLADEINRILPRPGGRGPGGPGGPGGPAGPPRGFGPGSGFAASIFKRADAEKTGKVTVNQLTAAAESLFKEGDKDKDGKLDDREIGATVALIAPVFRGPGGPGGRAREPAKPGPKLKPDEAKTYTIKESLYDPSVLRTFFLEFENSDWEAELADFKGTDVEVPATLVVDGKRYANVGVHFRGMSSYGMIPAGSKRSLNLSMDLVDPKQRLYGYKTLNLLNANDDPTFLHTVLYSHVARQHIPAPKANLVKLAINGESWGVYVNAQQFNKEFTQEFFKSDKGARWKVRGSPGGRGGLEYLGDNAEEYKRTYTLKSKDSDKAWKSLVNLCKVLNSTPADKLEAALKPILDIDGVLWFLALDVALVNNDGYWVRASDFSIYLDPRGKFHLVPHDMNETFAQAMGGPGMGRGPGGPGGGRGGDLDPLVGLTDSRKPLRSKLLAVPALKERYLKFVKIIAEQDLDWKKLGPTVEGYRKLIEREVEADTRKLYSLSAFKSGVADTADGEAFGRGLRSFADRRRKYLLEHPEIKKIDRE